MRDQEKQILLKRYAQASGVPLQEVKSMHTQTAEEPEYHDMAAGGDEHVPMKEDHEQYIPHSSLTSLEPRYGQMFGPPIDTRHQDIQKVIEQQPTRSKTKVKIQKQTGYLGNPNTNRKKKMVDEELDDEIERYQDKR